MKKMIISVNGKKYDVEVEVIEDNEEVLQGQTFYNPSLFKSENYGLQNPDSDNVIIARPSNVKPSGTKVQNSPVNGKVLEIFVKDGQKINERDKIMAIEAMKMKTNIYSAKTGTIAKVNVAVGDSVEQSTVLIEFE